MAEEGALQGSRQLVEHHFRHEYARLVSSLVRAFGAHHLEEIEDAVQSALAIALTSWSLAGIPEQPKAWLSRVAKNQLIDDLRRRNVASRAAENSELTQHTTAPATATFLNEIADDELRMLFICCDERLPIESQLVLALKTLCGLSTQEIALRLLTSEANVHKRLSRGRDKLRAERPTLETPGEPQLTARLEAVLQVIYLLFNEGYSSALPDQLIRQELCQEALRLGLLVVEHPVGDRAEAWALLALMFLHAARLDSRVDGAGGLLLLEEQDRSLWDRELMQEGLRCLSRSANGEVFSRYHAEAAVLSEHCMAPTFAETRWQEIIDLYLALERLSPSPLHTLNRAIAVAELEGAAKGLAILKELQPPAWLLGYYLWDATLGELERRTGNLNRAREHLARALAAAPTKAERALMRRRLTLCEEPSDITSSPSDYADGLGEKRR